MFKAKSNSIVNWSNHDLPFPYKALTRNTGIIGTTGSGKTVALEEMMAQVQPLGYKAIVYDIKGSLIEHFYREGKDIIFNPIDERFATKINWSLGTECKSAADFDRIAATMMPEHTAATDPFWIKSARTIFSAAARRLKQKNCYDTRELLRQIFSDASDEDKLAELLKGTEAESLVSQDIKQVALSIKATLTNYCKALMYLPEHNPANRNFSISDWIADENDDSWLFISVVDDGQHEALKPLISIWVDIAFQAILRLKKNRDRRIFSFIDELPSLQRLSSLGRLLSLGRDYGNAFFTTVQSPNQFKTVYGSEADTITGLLSTKLFMNVECAKAAKWMSEALFTSETIENKENQQYGANERGIKDGKSISENKNTAPIVLPGEFATLDECEGFLRFPGNLPVAKVSFAPRDYKIIAPDLVPRDIALSEFDLSNIMPKSSPDPKNNFQCANCGYKNHDEHKQHMTKLDVGTESDQKTQISEQEEISEKKSKRKPRSDRGKSRVKKNSDDADSIDIQEDDPKEFKTVVGYVASPKFKKNDNKRTMFFTVNLGEEHSVSDQNGYSVQSTTWYKLLFFGSLAEDALKKITKGCRLEVYGEYKRNIEINEDGEESCNHEIVVKKFKILSNAREKKKPKKEDLKTAKIYEESKDLERGEYVYEMGGKSISR